MKVRVFWTTICAAVLVGSASSMPQTARADVKVVSDTSLTGLEELGARGVPSKTTRYYKNGMMRDEDSADNYVHIYDSVKDKYYTLDLVAQTYSVRSLDEVLDSADGSLAKVETDGSATVEAGGSTQKIAGKAAKNYTTVSNLMLKASGSGVRLLGIKIQGEQWTADTLAFPATNTRLIKASFLLPTDAHKIFKAFYDKVGVMKGVPLSYDLTLSFQGLPGVAVPAAADRLLSGTFEAHSTVSSISTKTLPDYLFRVPKGYKLVPRIIEKHNED